ncbi:6-phosphogluconolactonase [Siccirubricoccus sp. G192]|uniref:6-phosphogluconolactonase n=1 Tax=Siccirubricoccus sp. G192 TaxID=2849651 RepID=UPI001C2C44EB|nr:6-phosphogluconolactonase [Siccirubricoccus sp. G192]MBV1795737.1 6-phosphogluconolactonase [Siccirubricoccus sp. G192]
MTPIVEVLADPEALAERVAAWLVERATAKRGGFSLALSGGSTPKRLYRRLAALPWRGRVPWGRMHLFWGDERFVQPDHPDSNQRMAREAMIAQVPIPPGNVHPVPVDGTPEEVARRYETKLRAFAAQRPGEPLFDVQLLGLGPDGHTASLFPGTPALAERRAWVVAVLGAKPEPRITLTYPALDDSDAVAFLVSGAEKQAILRRLLNGDAALPAAAVRPKGTITVFADQAAMGV